METQNILELVRNAGLVAKSVLVILAGFSIFSWAVIVDRLWLLRKAQRESRRFLESFRSRAKFSEIRNACAKLETAPLCGMFIAAYSELSAQLASQADAAPSAAPRTVDLEILERTLRRAASQQHQQLQRMMLFLATTASATPFIGLFGTVWGIMDAFRSIGTFGTANLAIVAPGISEALVTTAGGLAAAIPAVIFYNHLAGRIRTLTSMMEDFGLEFLNVAQKTFRAARQ